MKNTFLNIVCPPLFMFIVYYNIDFFMYNFDSREKYLNKQLEKAKKNYATLSNNSRNSTASAAKLEALQKEFKQRFKTRESYPDERENVYDLIEKCQLTLVSEKTIKQKKLGNSVAVLSVGGHYAKIIEFIKLAGENGHIPISLEMKLSTSGQSHYNISLLDWRAL